MDRKPEEYLAAVEFEIPQKEVCFSFEKVSTRRNLDIASVNTAAAIAIDENNIIRTLHLSAGGVGPIPMYLHQTVSFLRGKELSEANLKKAVAVMQEEIAPISDARGTAEYKRMLLRQLVLAHFQKAAPEMEMIDILKLMK